MTLEKPADVVLVRSLFVLLFALVACGRRAPAVTDGSFDQDGAANDVVASPVDGDMADGDTRDIRAVPVNVGDRAFNEPLNDQFARDVIPTWKVDDLVISSSGLISGTISTTFAGDAPSSAAHRDAFFWNVTGYVPNGAGGEYGLSLSDIQGRLASSTNEGSAVFLIDGSFQTGPEQLTGSERLSTIAVGFTWVRVYRAEDGSISYHVLPGTRTSAGAASLPWDRAVIGLNGTFGYYAVLADRSALGGGDFDYPSWIRANVIW